MTPNLRAAYKASGKDRFLPKDATLQLASDTFRASSFFASVEAVVNAPSASPTTIVLELTRKSTDQPWQLLDFHTK